MEYVLKQSLPTESAHKGLRKSAGEPSCVSTIDLMVGQPGALVDLRELYIKVCESVTVRLDERDFEGMGRGNLEVEGCVSAAHKHTRTPRESD